MTTIEEKLSLFSKIIHDKINEEKKEKLDAFSLCAKTKIDMEKEHIEELRKSLQRESQKKANTKANGIVAKEKLNKKREILFLREELIKETIGAIRARLIEFVRSSEYKAYLINNLQNTLNVIDKGHYYIFLVKIDYEKFQNEIVSLLREYHDHNVEMKSSEEDFLGGYILKDYDGKFRIDNSVRAAVQDSKEIVGVRIMEILA